MRGRALRLAVAAAVCAGAVATDGAQRPPAAHAWSLRIPSHQYNLCGFAPQCPQRWPSDVSAEVVNFYVTHANPRPWVVTVNEVCGNQHATMSNHLRGLGYSALRSQTEFFPDTCGVLGNSMFLLGGWLGAQYRTEYVYPTQDGDPNDDETRKLMCMIMNSVVGHYNACVTHLDPQVAATQEDQALSYVRYWYGTGPRLVGGDFNIGWSSSQLNDWRTYTTEIDSTAKLTYPALGSKVDFVWGDRAHFPTTSPSPAFVDCNLDYSDHCYLAGTHYV